MEYHPGYASIPMTCPENYRTRDDYKKAFDLWNQVVRGAVGSLAFLEASALVAITEHNDYSPLSMGLGIVALGSAAFAGIKYGQLENHCDETLLKAGQYKILV